MGEAGYLTVSDLKQYAYCPRIVFYRYCLPLLRPTTYKMNRSHQAHAHQAELDQRRSLAAFGLSQGERAHNVRLRSTRMGLLGVADLVIYTDAEAIPVDYKMTRTSGHLAWHAQLAAYGMMLQEEAGLTAKRGFLYPTLAGRPVEIPLTDELRQRVEHWVASMRRMVKLERMPPAVRRRGKCIECEFRRFCNDVD
ncbi:MAG: CRISPR-associated protein Cas4 [Anaerolineae bacterium]